MTLRQCFVKASSLCARVCVCVCVCVYVCLCDCVRLVALCVAVTPEHTVYSICKA